MYFVRCPESRVWPICTPCINMCDGDVSRMLKIATSEKLALRKSKDSGLEFSTPHDVFDDIVDHTGRNRMTWFTCKNLHLHSYYRIQ